VRRGGVTAANKKLALDDLLHQPGDFNGPWQRNLPYLQRQVNFITGKDVTGKDVLSAADYKLMGHSVAAAKRAVENVRDQRTYDEAIRFLRNMWSKFRALEPEVKTPQPSPPGSPRGTGQAQSRGRRRLSSLSSQGIDEVLIAPEFQELHDFLTRELEGFRGGMPFATDALVYMCGPPGLVFDFLSQRGLLPFPLGEVELEHWMRMVLFLINAYREESGLSWRHEGSGRRPRHPKRGGRRAFAPMDPNQPPPPPEEEVAEEEDFALVQPEVQLFVELMDWLSAHLNELPPPQIFDLLDEGLQPPVTQIVDDLGVDVDVLNPGNFPNPQAFLGYILDWMRDANMRIGQWMEHYNYIFNEDVTYFTPPS
jgi:hypothetical protein